MAYNGNNYQTRRNQDCCDGWEHKMSNGQWMCGKEHGICENNAFYGRKGGRLMGPSHKRGGIPAIVGGREQIELEGGEYIINAQTVKAVGEGFLNKLNSTATTYHPGGFNQGQLPDSMYARGGKVSNRRNKMRRGRKPTRKMQYGGQARRTGVSRGRKLAKGTARRRPTTTSKSRGRVARKATSPMRGRALGNKTARARKASPVSRKYQNGGSINSLSIGGYECPNSQNYPQNIYLLQQPTRIDGTAGEYFCCKNRWRDQDCNLFDEFEVMPGLIMNTLTNLNTSR